MSILTKLFRWTRKLDIKDGDKTVGTVYIKLVGDAAYQEARVIALRYSKELRAKLRNPESDEYIANFLDLDAMEKSELITGITMGEIGDYRDEALITLKNPVPPELVDNPTLEQQEEHEKALSDIQETRVKELTAAMEKRSEERRVELEKVEMVELRKLYKTSIINIRTSDEFSRAFRDYQVYKGTFTDAAFKSPAFASFAEYNECSPQLKGQLLTAYTSLEISGEDLKN
jgi:hypothetical protein